MTEPRIIVTWRDRRFVCYCGAAQAHIPRAAGFLWDGRARQWWTRDPEAAERMRTSWDRRVEQVFEVIRRRRAEIEKSRATDADIEVPAPEGCRYLGYQRAGIAFCRQRPNVLIADQMGLGKTIQAIGVINDARGAIRRVLVVCPAGLKLNWRNELMRWLVDDSFTIGIAEGKCWPHQHDIVIANYDICERHKQHINAHEWDLLIVDECHHLKSQKARRTKVLLGGRLTVNGQGALMRPVQAKRALFLTGTPICNRPAELWPLIHYLDRGRWANYLDYARRYCAAYNSEYGLDANGHGNLDELQRILRATIMIRRLKQDVLKELPPKTRQIIEIPASADMRDALALERTALARHRPHLDALREAVERAARNHDERAYRDAVNKLEGGFKVGFEEMSAVRKAVALAKAPYVIAHVRDALEESEKVVLFAHHREVLFRFREAFDGQAVLLYGDTKMQDRQSAVERFQQDPKVRLFIGGIIPAGVGITLTASSHVVFAELDWVPGNVEQASDRCHRIGQRDSVLVQFLVLPYSLDSYIARMIVRKAEIIEQALDWAQDGAPTSTPAPEPQPRIMPPPARVFVGQQRELFGA